MRPPLPLLLAPISVVPFMLASGTVAQCPPQRITSPSELGSEYGYVLAMNDRHLIVGDPRDYTLCGDPFCANGYAWAYQRDADGQWAFTQRLEPADLGWSNGFGRQISLDGDRVLISRILGIDCGGLPYLFEFDGEQWVETARLCPPPGRGDDGNPIALYGDTALTSVSVDSVLIYREVEGVWSVVQELSNPDSPTMRSGFGNSFTLDDQWLFVGAALESTLATQHGAVYVYRRRDGGDVEFAQKLLPSDVDGVPRFGTFLTVHTGVLMVAGNTATRTHSAQGVVYCFELIDGCWEAAQEITHDRAADGDSLGTSIALERDLMVVGAHRKVTSQGTGAAFVFRRGVDGLWRQAAELVPQRDTYDFGEDVALSGTMAAVGAADAFTPRGADGAVDIFDLSCLLCRPDLDADGALTIFDFLTFLNLFQAGDVQADFDGDGELTVFDFLAFQTAFDAGCG